MEHNLPALLRLPPDAGFAGLVLHIALRGATAREILELSDRMVSGVEEKFGVKLEREPVYLG